MKAASVRLKEIFSRVHRINHAVTYLNWDQMVMMPAKGVEDRSRSLAELAAIRHELLSNPEMSSLLDEAGDSSTNAREFASLREMRREWSRVTSIPSELEEAQIVAGAKCEHAWREQRANNDWKGFLANFKEVVKLSRQEAIYRQATDVEQFPTPYDAMLDLHCAGDSSAMISSVFSDLKQKLPDLLRRVLDVQKDVNWEARTGRYDLNNQLALNKRLMSDLGFDFDRGRLDQSMHPFSTGSGNDLRITTRFRETEFSDALQATAHETGHASYEGNLPQDWKTLPVGGSRNMCVHESQSLLFEKQIFLSKAFTRFFTPVIKQHLEDCAKLNADRLWQLSTRVQPSYIRVEADEVTYPLHVMLRFDIESELINGGIEAEDIPEVWDKGMTDYLGLSTKEDYNNGCLQDIHWTDGAFGYFPSYTLGAINAAQIFATIRKAYPDWQDRFEAGSTGFVMDWLKVNIWQQGSFLESQDLIKQATGEETNASFLLDHLEARYINQEH